MFQGKKCRRRRISETREECWYVNIDSFRYSNTHYSYGDIRQITEGKHWRNLRPQGTNHVVYACVCTAYHITPFISFGRILRESWTKMLHTYFRDTFSLIFFIGIFFWPRDMLCGISSSLMFEKNFVKKNYRESLRQLLSLYFTGDNSKEKSAWLQGG